MIDESSVSTDLTLRSRLIRPSMLHPLVDPYNTNWSHALWPRHLGEILGYIKSGLEWQRLNEATILILQRTRHAFLSVYLV